MLELNFPNPVSEEKDFYDRRIELKRIENTFMAGSGRPVIILGERRIGKTSLQTVTIKRLTADVSGQFTPLILPPASSIRSLNDYAKEILRSLCRHLGQNYRGTGLVDEKGRFQLISFGQFIDVIASLVEAASKKTFVICVDEFDAVLINCPGSEADKILGLTDHLIEKPDLPFIAYFTMTRLPEEIRKSFHSPGISKSEVIEIAPFPQLEMEEMVTGLLGNQVMVVDAAMERLFQLSGGHPYFVKLLLDRLLARFWSANSVLSVFQEMIEQIIPDATHDPRALHAVDNIYKVHFNQQEQELILLLAERGASVKAEELKLLGGPFITAAKRLHRRGYLARSEENSYDFHIEFLGWWLRDWEEYDEELERLEAIKSLLNRSMA